MLLLSAAMAVVVGQATAQVTDQPQVYSTWPDDIYPGENCLPYDGSKVPDCSEYIDPNHYIPYYHEHSQSRELHPA